MKIIKMKMNNLKTIVILMSICLFCSSCSNQTKNINKFTLNGKIINQKQGLIILEYTPDSVMIKDTVFIKNGEFTFNGSIQEPTQAYLTGDNNEQVLLYLESKTMTITLIKDHFEKFKLEGSKTQLEYEQLELIKSKNKENNSLESNILKFILTNPNSFTVPFELLRLQESYFISLDSVKSIFKGFNISVQNSKTGKRLKSNILKEEKIQIGEFPPNFNAIDINGKQITLNQFKGKKVVLLDFWASWCAPCRKSFPHLKELHQKYHKDGFEILAISVIDHSKESWKKAIDKDNINDWYNIASVFMDGKGINKVFIEDYNPLPIPKKILIDRTGQVAGVWVGYSEEIENNIAEKLNKIMSAEK